MAASGAAGIAHTWAAPWARCSGLLVSVVWLWWLGPLSGALVRTKARKRAKHGHNGSRNRVPWAFGRPVWTFWASGCLVGDLGRGPFPEAIAGDALDLTSDFSANFSQF